MGIEKLDFLKDVPQELIVEGVDAFLERGRYLLFIEMIGFTAKDLCLPPEHKDYQDAASWLADTTNIQGWCGMIDANQALASVIAQAIRDRPREIAYACEMAMKGVYASTTDFSSFMEAMGIPKTGGASSLQDFHRGVEGFDFTEVAADTPGG
jgi:hypothetical protein